jgi:hypothetical protein
LKEERGKKKKTKTKKEEEEEEEEEECEFNCEINSSKCLTGHMRASDKRIMVRNDVRAPVSVFRCVGMVH